MRLARALLLLAGLLGVLAIGAVLAAAANLYLARPLHAFGSGKILLLISGVLGVAGGIRALLRNTPRASTPAATA